jgi:hypothetical protein
MPRAFAFAAAVLAILTTTAAGVAAQAAEPILGSWQLNVARSRYHGPAPRSEIRTFTVAGTEIKATTKGIDSAGNPYADEWIINYDGKEYPIESPNADTVIRRRVDPLTIELTLKKAGKIVSTGRRVISKDGKTMTITGKGVNAKGEAFDTMEIFEKQ